MVVVDSSVIIPLLNIGKVWILEKCFRTGIIIPRSVWIEVVEEGKRLGKNVLPVESASGGFDIVKCPEKELLSIKGLEKADLEVVSIAFSRKDIVITNDATLHSVAKSQGIDAWWLTTLIMHSVRIGVIGKEDGKNMLLELVSRGAYLKPEILSQLLLHIENI
ncbi:hypothetical protein HYV82_01930 [Candidatus Woesearchaeota archaeon]|nr:hypothetical protein [Candidatus Woesearchaeota archaeon]